MLIIHYVHLSVYDTVYVLLTIQKVLVIIFVFFSLLCNKHIVTYKLSASKLREKETHISLKGQCRYFDQGVQR